MLVVIKHSVDPFFGAEIVAKKHFPTVQTYIRQIRSFDSIDGVMGAYKDGVLRFYPDSIMEGTLHSTDSKKVSDFFNSLKEKGWGISSNGMENFPKYSVEDFYCESAENPPEEDTLINDKGVTLSVPSYTIKDKRGAINSLTISQAILYQYIKEKLVAGGTSVVITKKERNDISFLNYENGIVLTPERILQLAKSVRLKSIYTIDCLEGGDIAFHITSHFYEAFEPTGGKAIPKGYSLLKSLVRMPEGFDAAFLRREAYRIEKEKRIAKRHDIAA